jgi:hypothetical protein
MSVSVNANNKITQKWQYNHAKFHKHKLSGSEIITHAHIWMQVHKLKYGNYTKK